jgi:hypothetical protein
MPQINQGVGHQFHPVVALLDVLETEEQPFEFVLPRKRPLDSIPQRMDGGIEQSLAPALGALTIARILWDVRDQAGIENTLPIVGGIKATIEVEIAISQVQTDLFGYPFQGL